MKIFTIASGDVTEGARVDSFTLKGAGVSIPAIIIGEEGRGRKLGILPVQLLPESYREWQEKGSVEIFAAEVGQTKSGGPKLFQTEEATTNEKCICVFRTGIGFRGSNSHTGDVKEVYWVLDRAFLSDLPEEHRKAKYTEEEAWKLYLDYLVDDDEWREYIRNTSNIYEQGYFEKVVNYYPFPGEVLCEGIIAEGAAGRMGSGSQIVAVMPAGIVFRTGYSGRLYGAPSAHYYIYRNGQLLSATWKEREVSDIF